MFQNHLLTKSYYSSVVIAPYTAVKLDPANNEYVLPATSATDLVIGVTNELGFTATDVSRGSNVDVVLVGIAQVAAGSAIATPGTRVTINASGQVIAAAPAAGANVQLLGVTLLPASSGDVIPVLLHLSVVQG